MEISCFNDSAADTGLRKAVQQAARLETLRSGRHVVRNAQQLKLGEIVVRKLWVVRVQPPTTLPACLASVMTDHQTTIFFAVYEADDNLSVAVNQVQFDSQQEDPVATALSSIDLWSGGNSIPLVGCSYKAFVDTAQLQATLRFSNPRDPSRMALETALLKLANQFETEGLPPVSVAFVHNWVNASQQSRQTFPGA